MKTFILELYQKNIQVFQLGLENYYVNGNYKIKNYPGLVSYISWVGSSGRGVGMISVQIGNDKIIYLRTLDNLLDKKDIKHENSLLTVSGGCLKLQNIYYGIARFCQRDRNCMILSIEYCEMTPGKNTFSQLQLCNLLLTNKKVYTTTVEPGNINSTFRVGTFDVHELNTGVFLGSLLFETYNISLSSGFGIQAFDLQNQIFFNMFNSFYFGSILDPIVQVKNVVGSTVGGQKFNRYLKNGYFNFENFLPSLDEVYNISFCNQLLPIYKSFESMTFIAKDKKVFVYESSQIQGSIRIGQWSVSNTLDDSLILGTLYFQTYVVTNNSGMGLMVLELKDRGCIFNQFRTLLTNPLDPKTMAINTAAIVGGTGYFKKIDWGYMDFENFSGTDQKISIFYNNHSN